MNGIIIRYQFMDPNPVRSSDLVDLLKQSYGGAISFLASDTIFIDIQEPAEAIYDLLSPLFTFDDKLFVGEVQGFRSLHHVSRVRPSLRKVAI